jgi:serine/threonine protein kinase
MMPCPSAAQLAELLAATLPADDRNALEDHLAGCASCQEKLVRLTDDEEETRWREVFRGTGVSGTVRDGEAGRLEPSEDFLERLRKELAPHSHVIADSIETPQLATTRAEGVRRPPAPSGSWRLGPYTVLRELGRGGMGVVYLAHDERLQRRVAIKMMWPTALDLKAEHRCFLREAELIARLKHPNIVQVYEAGEHDGGSYLVMELVEGPSLHEQIRGTPQSPPVAAALVRTLALAMHHAHLHQVIHRDLKPSNVLLATDGPARGDAGPSLADCVPKISDFGLARPLDVPAGISYGSRIVGTPSYMAPEQASPPSAEGKEGKAPAIGPATDIYGLGAILYELLTGRPPFQGLDPLHTLLQVRHHEPVPPSRLQPKVSRDLETTVVWRKGLTATGKAGVFHGPGSVRRTAGVAEGRKTPGAEDTLGPELPPLSRSDAGNAPTPARRPRPARPW